MAYNEIQPAAFIPNPDNTDLHADLYTLGFPAHWRDPVIELYQIGLSASKHGRIKEVPIKKLNSLIRTVAPDLVTADANASFDPSRPWLYSRNDCPMRPLTRMIRTWLRTLAPSDEAWQQFRETARTVDPEKLQWKPETIDLLEHTITAGGTRAPADRLYRVLPEILADRIAEQEPYAFNGEYVRFHRVAVDARAQGAELMSWPPLKHITKVTNEEHKKRYGSQREWRYSAVINVSLRTIPFSPTPRIHITTRIRRWVAGEVPMPGTRNVSAYLLTQQPFVDDVQQPGRFAVAQFFWNHRTRKVEWRNSGTEGMLERVGALDNLPAADVFAKEPDNWIDGRDGIEGSASYHTMMGWHGVGAGLMPAERRRLTEWAGQALAPEFIPEPPLFRSSIKQNPSKHLTPRVSIPKKDASPEQIEKAIATNAVIDLNNAIRRRENMARALDRHELTAVVLYQTEAMRDELISAAETSLGLAEYRAATGPRLWSWTTPELHVRIHTRRLGELGAPLNTNGQPPKKGNQHIASVGQRRNAVAGYLRELTTQLGETCSITFIELEGQKSFKQRTTDPKFALRLGCADLGMASQFFTPIDKESKEEEDEDAFLRTESAWADGLRQLGMRLVPPHTLGDKIPENLNQLAFWIVKRQVTSETDRAQFTPVAVLIRPGQNRILGRTPDMSEWVPYPQLLIALTGQIRPDELTTKEQQTKTVAAFVQNILYSLRTTPTLVITHAHNTRSRWPWLTNTGLQPDRIQLGNEDSPAQRIQLFGHHLRFARIATNDRDETPQWWAPAGTESGIGKGLWKLPNNDGKARVFYSTSDKTANNKLPKDATKLTNHGENKKLAGKNASNPELLQITMLGFRDDNEAENWAMFLHQQRFAEDYRNALALPLIQHIAKLTNQYGLPHADDESEQLVEPSESEDKEGANPQESYRGA